RGPGALAGSPKVAAGTGVRGWVPREGLRKPQDGGERGAGKDWKLHTICIPHPDGHADARAPWFRHRHHQPRRQPSQFFSKKNQVRKVLITCGGSSPRSQGRTSVETFKHEDGSNEVGF